MVHGFVVKRVSFPQISAGVLRTKSRKNIRNDCKKKVIALQRDVKTGVEISNEDTNSDVKMTCARHHAGKIVNMHGYIGAAATGTTINAHCVPPNRSCQCHDLAQRSQPCEEWLKTTERKAHIASQNRQIANLYKMQYALNELQCSQYIYENC